MFRTQSIPHCNMARSRSGAQRGRGVTHRRFRPINPAFVGLWLALAVASGVHAAPLRLSLDAQSVVPAAEVGQAPPAPVADDDRQPGDDLSFVAAPDLAFPDLADAAAADADWLVAARAHQDDARSSRSPPG